MKKILLGLFAILGITAAAVVNVNIGKDISKNFSEVVLTGLEALSEESVVCVNTDDCIMSSSFIASQTDKTYYKVCCELTTSYAHCTCPSPSKGTLKPNENWKLCLLP